MEIVEFNGWKNNVRLSNDEVEVIITKDVGPRIIRFGFIGEKNLFGEIAGQQGVGGESEWMIRGGHRLWIAPEEQPKSYELDNSPVQVEEVEGGALTSQEPGPVASVRKTMDIRLAPGANEVTVTHALRNEGEREIELAVWALSVMAVNGMAIIPLPAKIPHTERLTHNQEWSIWGYTDFSDPRWTLGSRYVFFRQDTTRGPNKLGMAHREGWVGYQLDGFLFVKRFDRVEGADYPDAGMNFETFSNEDFLEVETLGPLTVLQPGESATHTEKWQLFSGVPRCKTEDEVDANIRPLL